MIIHRRVSKRASAEQHCDKTTSFAQCTLRERSCLVLAMVARHDQIIEQVNSSIVQPVGNVRSRSRTSRVSDSHLEAHQASQVKGRL
jgi:hypothetical protein